MVNALSLYTVKLISIGRVVGATYKLVCDLRQQALTLRANHSRRSETELETGAIPAIVHFNETTTRTFSLDRLCEVLVYANLFA